MEQVSISFNHIKTIEVLNPFYKPNRFKANILLDLKYLLIWVRAVWWVIFEIKNSRLIRHHILLEVSFNILGKQMKIAPRSRKVSNVKIYTVQDKNSNTSVALNLIVLTTKMVFLKILFYINFVIKEKF